MTRLQKNLLLMLSAVLLVAVSVLGTLAYFTDTDSVTNTFSVGDIALTLDETDVDTAGKQDGDTRVQANEYHLLPGQTYIKDPTVTVTKGSEDCYVRMVVKVTAYDQLKAAFSAPKYYGTDGTFLLQNLCNGWEPATWKYIDCTVSGDGKTAWYEFRYKDVVAKDDTQATTLDPLFTSITVPGEITNADLAKLDAVEITVTAHAMQEAGFEDNEALAWEKFGPVTK